MHVGGAIELRHVRGVAEVRGDGEEQEVRGEEGDDRRNARDTIGDEQSGHHEEHDGDRRQLRKRAPPTLPGIEEVEGDDEGKRGRIEGVRGRGAHEVLARHTQRGGDRSDVPRLLRRQHHRHDQSGEQRTAGELPSPLAQAKDRRIEQHPRRDGGEDALPHLRRRSGRDREQREQHHRKEPLRRSQEATERAPSMLRRNDVRLRVRHVGPGSLRFGARAGRRTREALPLPHAPRRARASWAPSTKAAVASASATMADGAMTDALRSVSLADVTCAPAEDPRGGRRVRTSPTCTPPCSTCGRWRSSPWEHSGRGSPRSMGHPRRCGCRRRHRRRHRSRSWGRRASTRAARSIAIPFATAPRSSVSGRRSVTDRDSGERITSRYVA